MDHPPLADLGSTWALVPLRGLEDAKTRLGAELDAEERVELVVAMATRTLAATRAAPGIRGTVLVTADPAAAASAAPEAQTGVATGLTNSVKTVGGAIASCVFGIALLHGVASTAGGAEGTAGSLEGYFTVWIVCGITALAAAVLLVFVPKQAFTDRTVADSEQQPATM